MPIYGLFCKDCGHEFERMMKASEKESARVLCERCQSDNVIFQITAHGGYSVIAGNGASSRPSQAGSFRKK